MSGPGYATTILKLTIIIVLHVAYLKASLLVVFHCIKKNGVPSHRARLGRCNKVGKQVGEIGQKTE